jgi:hypothetical protein
MTSSKSKQNTWQSPQGQRLARLLMSAYEESIANELDELVVAVSDELVTLMDNVTRGQPKTGAAVFCRALVYTAVLGKLPESDIHDLVNHFTTTLTKQLREAPSPPDKRFSRCQ